MINTVFFDLDGTIIDSGPGIKRCLRHTLAFYGIKDPGEERLNACVGPPLTESFHRHFGIPEAQVMEAVSVYRKEYNAGGIFECTLYPGIRRTLETLHEHGIPMAITSSKVDTACKRITDHFGITPFFYDIVGSTPDAKREKKADVINAFFEAHPDKSPGETVLVGDTHFDAEGAALSGVAFLGVTYGYEKPEVMRRQQALALLSEAAEIAPWILANRQA